MGSVRTIKYLVVDNVLDDVPDAAPAIDIEVTSPDDISALLRITHLPPSADIYLQTQRPDGSSLRWQPLNAMGALPEGSVLLAKVKPKGIRVRPETVHLSIEGGGAPRSLDANLVNGRVQVTTIKESLAALRLSLVSINGRVPDADSDGWSVDTYAPDSTLTIEAQPKPGVKVATAYAHAAPKSWLSSLWTLFRVACCRFSELQREKLYFVRTQPPQQAVAGRRHAP